MRNPAFRIALLYAGLAGVFILVDMALDLSMGSTPALNLPHLILAAIVFLTSYILLKRGLEARDRAEAALRQARDELETRVQARTAELARANAALQAEIAERKQVEQALRESERLFHNLAQVSPVGIFRTDVHGDCAYVNERWTEIAGITIERALGRGWTAAIHPEDRDTVAAEWYASVQERRPFRLEYRFQRPDSAVTWVLGQALSETDDTGQVVGYVGAITDITKRKRSEIELQRTQAELSRRIQERATMEERQRLARELHDSVSQSLYGISLGVHTALALFDSDRIKVIEALNYVLSLAQAGLAEMRALIFELRPESLKMEGLIVGLNKQAAAVRARHNIEVELDLCDEPDVSLVVKEALYRIAQEAIQNAVKHARPGKLDMRLMCEPDSLRLLVCDNGTGFDPLAAYPGHLGLRSMRERAQSLGGTLDIESVSDCGTQIRACIPIPVVQLA